MTPPSVPEGVKPPVPRPRPAVERAPAAPDLAEALLSGAPVPAGAPAAYADVARLLSALSAAPSAEETADEWRAIAAFRAAKEPAVTAAPVPLVSRAVRRRALLSALVTGKVLVATAAAAATVGTTAAVSFTGNLPAPLQDLAATAFGAPRADEAASDREDATDATTGAETSARTGAGLGAAGPAMVLPPAAAEPLPTATVPVSSPATAYALCTAYAAGDLAPGTVALRSLTAAAGGTGGIAGFCAASERPAPGADEAPEDRAPVGRPSGGPPSAPPEIPARPPVVVPTAVPSGGLPARRPGVPVASETTAPRSAPIVPMAPAAPAVPPEAPVSSERSAPATPPDGGARPSGGVDVTVTTGAGSAPAGAPAPRR